MLCRTYIKHSRAENLAAAYDECCCHVKEDTAMFGNGINSVLGVLILIGDIWAIINIFQSSVSNEKKLIWIVAVVLLPVLGLILWFFLGPRNGRT